MDSKNLEGKSWSPAKFTSSQSNPRMWMVVFLLIKVSLLRSMSEMTKSSRLNCLMHIASVSSYISGIVSTKEWKGFGTFTERSIIILKLRRLVSLCDHIFKFLRRHVSTVQLHSVSAKSVTAFNDTSSGIISVDSMSSILLSLPRLLCLFGM